MFTFALYHADPVAVNIFGYPEILGVTLETDDGAKIGSVFSAFGWGLRGAVSGALLDLFSFIRQIREIDSELGG